MSWLVPVLMAALVGLNAVFAAVEVALVEQDDGAEVGPSAGSAAHLGITWCCLALGLVAAGAGGLVAGSASAWVTAATLGAAIAAQVVLGELVPKSVSSSRSAALMRVLGAPFRAWSTLVAPVVALGARVGAVVARRALPEHDLHETSARSREELRHLVRQSRAGGELTDADAELLDRTLRLAGKTAADSLTPRVEVRSLDVDATVGDLMDLSAASGLSRFPVCGESLDDVLGVVHIKDVLSVPTERRRRAPLRSLMRSVLAVPESKDLEALMIELQEAAGQFAVVVDEYGGTAGIITLEDLVEEIVGEIDDEHDPTRSTPAVRQWAGAHLVAGRLHPDELTDACGLVLPEGDYETLGGFVMQRLGRVPSVGDRFDHGGWEVEVVAMDGRRVHEVRLVQRPGTVGSGSEQDRQDRQDRR